MGTNYYAKTNCCKACKRSDLTHLGKSSGGWVFSLHVYPDDGINTWADWKAKLAYQDVQIEDEYGNDVPYESFVKTVENRSWPAHALTAPYPYDSWNEFYFKNYAVPGPNGLVRHELGRGVIGHGEGTYDYLVGDFS